MRKTGDRIAMDYGTLIPFVPIMKQCLQQSRKKKEKTLCESENDTATISKRKKKPDMY
jgi:hypothetical protein